MEVGEMKDFFQKVVDEVATLSTQAQQVQGLQEQVTNLSNRVNQVEQANTELMTKLDEAQATIARLQDERSKVDYALEAERQHVVALRDANVARDTRVSELEGNLRSETDAHRITKADLEDSRRATSEQEARANGYQQRLNDTVSLLEEWRAKANDYERRNTELQTKFDQLRSVLSPSPIHVVSGDANVA